MASTKAKKKTEIVKKIIEEQAPVLEKLAQVEQVGPVKDKFLHLSQLRSIEVCERDVLNAKLVMGMEEQALQNLMLQQKYLSLAIEKQRLTVEGKAKLYETEKQRYELIAKDIRELHGIEDIERFAYDPNTGKIIV